MKNIIANIINLKRVRNGLHPTLRIRVAFVGDTVMINNANSINYLTRHMKHEL